MKSRKYFYFYILHFIIFLSKIFFSNSKLSSNRYSPNYSFLDFSISNNTNNSLSISIWINEFISNETNINQKYKYFITTSKTGIISIISQNETLFSIDLKKKMYKTNFTTNFTQENLMKGDNGILPMEGKLFRVKTIYAKETFEEFTTPINELVDKTPFYLWFSEDNQFKGNKTFSIINVINKNKNNVFNGIYLNNIILVDNTLICIQDKQQVWDTTITNIYFNKDIKEIFVNNNKKFNIEENILIYENNDIMDEFIKENIGDKLNNDILYIHAYDITKNKYIKIYDYNTYTHIIQNTSFTDNSTEEQKTEKPGHYYDKDTKITYYYYNNKIIYQYKYDFIVYYCIVFFIFLCTLILLLNNFIYKSFFVLKSNIKNIFLKKGKNKYQQQKNILFNDKMKSHSVSYNDIFINVQNYFRPNSFGKAPLKNKINKMRVLINKDIKSIKKSEHSNSATNLKSEMNINFDFSSSNIISIKKQLCTLKDSKAKNNFSQQGDNKPQTRLERDFKEITPIKKSIFRNSIDVLLKAKHKIDEQLYTIKIKKLTNPNEEQSVIAEAQNMKKIRSKHIVEYITCWLDSSVGSFNYLFNDNNNNNNDDINDDDIFFSSKSNSKVGENNFKTLISSEGIKNDHYVKQLYTKGYISDDESTTNKKKKVNIDNKFYKKKDENKNSINININNKKINFKQKYTYIDDSSIKNKKFKDHRNLPDLSIYFFIQMEFCQQMTLAQYIEDHSNTKINNKVIYTFTYQLIKSLAKIHSKNIIHANINPENIFVINEDSIKIGDFSSAKDIELKFKKKVSKYNTNKLPLSQSYQNIMELMNNDDNIETDYVGESLYSSPEQNKGNGVSKKSDIYSVGLVLYEMCECFPDDEKRNKGINFLKKNKVFGEKFRREYELQCRLILQMIEDDQDKRPSCDELLENKDMQDWKYLVSNEN